MPVKTIHDIEPLVPVLDGTEELEAQLAGGGASLRTTAQAIANLAAPVFAYAFYTVNAAVAQGDVIAGANLRTVPGVGPEQYAVAASGNPQVVAYPVVVGAPLTGTWMALGDMLSYTDLAALFLASANASSGLFLKVT